MTQANGARAARTPSESRARRTLTAVAISALVAAGVATPMALRVGDGVDPAEAPTTSSAPDSGTGSTSTTSTSTTVPVQVLGTSTIQQGGPGG